jgi:hypothetical protein
MPAFKIDDERAYNYIRAERRHQVAKGRGPEQDDERDRAAWFDCFRTIRERFGRCPVGSIGWARMWIKIGSIAVAVIQSHERKYGPLPDSAELERIDLGEEPLK